MDEWRVKVGVAIGQVLLGLVMASLGALDIRQLAIVGVTGVLACRHVGLMR